MGKLHQLTPHIPRTALTADESALSAGVSRSRIFEAIRCGDLVARAAGKSTIIEFDELKRWIASLPARGGTRPDVDAAEGAAPAE